MKKKLTPEEQRVIVAEWQSQVGGLLDQVEGWAQSQGWEVERTQTQVREEPLPEYSTENLDIHVAGEKRVYLKPVARFTFNGTGAVELYGWPSLNRVRLQPEDGSAKSWIVMTDSGIPLHDPWESKSFVRLVNDLVAW